MTEMTFYNDYSERSMDGGSGDIDMRKNNNYGFTLAELLIVVAIIAVLVAISIPIFGTQLERSREAVDAANIRSQYAQVITDAILDGGDVNGKDKYGAVNLKQQQSDWQNTEMETNLHSIYNEVVGTPAAGGIAWVEYKAANDSTILHYEGGSSSGGSGSGDSSSGGGSSSGSSGTDTGGNTDSGSGGSSSGTTFGGTATEWNLITAANPKGYIIELGKIYSWGGNLYIGCKAFEIEEYHINNSNPDTFAGWYALSKYTGNTIDISVFKNADQNQGTPVKRGDVCKVRDEYYIFKDGGERSNGPLAEDNRWQKIITDQ